MDKHGQHPDIKPCPNVVLSRPRWVRTECVGKYPPSNNLQKAALTLFTQTRSKSTIPKTTYSRSIASRLRSWSRVATVALIATIASSSPVSAQSEPPSIPIDSVSEYQALERTGSQSSPSVDQVYCYLAGLGSPSGVVAAGIGLACLFDPPVAQASAQIFCYKDNVDSGPTENPFQSRYHLQTRVNALSNGQCPRGSWQDTTWVLPGGQTVDDRPIWRVPSGCESAPTPNRTIGSNGGYVFDGWVNSPGDSYMPFINGQNDIRAWIPAAPQYTSIRPSKSEWGDVWRLYSAVYQRHPDTAGFKYWTTGYYLNKRPTALTQYGLRQDVSLTEMASYFTSSAEFYNKFGNVSNESFVRKFYCFSLNRTPDSAGLGYWTGLLNTNQASRAQVVLAISQAPEYRALTGAYS